MIAKSTFFSSFVGWLFPNLTIIIKRITYRRHMSLGGTVEVKKKKKERGLDIEARRLLHLFKCW